MRKLYALLAGLFAFLLTSVPASATPDLPGFTFTVTPGNNVNFANTTVLGSEPGVRHAFWSFGDGTGAVTGPLEGIVHHYNQTGTFNVCLKIYRYGTNAADSVLSGQICQTITLQDSCHAEFSFTSAASNALGRYFIAAPQHSGNKKPVQICWNFGDGHDTCIQYPTTFTGAYAVFHQYAQPDSFNVCVTITYDGGCQASTCHNIVVIPPPSCTAAFEIPATNVPGLLKYFVAIPGNSQNLKPVRVCWTFGDGRDTCIQYPTSFTGPYAVSHLYAQTGNYNVCVNILYDGGCQATSCRSIAVNGPDSCRADFERVAPVAGTSPWFTYFNALPWHSNNKKPVRICWTFGDNTDTCIQYSTTQNPPYPVAHHYAAPGTYTVCVNILYDGGCQSQLCKTIVLQSADSCNANFERLAINPTSNPLVAVYQAIPWNSHNNKPARVCWSFGDGRDTCINYLNIYAGNYTVEHRYLQPGTYTVCVNILYYGGCESHLCKPVIIGHADSCRADFQTITANAGTVPNLVYFQAIPWQSNNQKPARVCWTFGDGHDTCLNYTSSYNGNYVVSHRYDQPGYHNVCVNILYFGGCESHLCKQIWSGPDSCTARLFEITPSITSLVRGFVAVPNVNPSRRVVRVCWYFGDGTDTCIVTNPTVPPPIGGYIIRHTYPAPGVYRACVKILYEGGCIGQDCKEVTIRPEANICGGFAQDSIVGPRSFFFRGVSIHAPNDAPVSFTWSFGDGSSQVGREVTHTFANAGNYNVCLLIRTQLGCETRICHTVRVPGNNEPALHLSPNPVVNMLHVQFFSTHTETVTVRIINPYGVVVRTYTRAVNTGNNSWDLDLSTLASGVYNFVLQSPNQLASAIFFKQ